MKNSGRAILVSAALVVAGGVAVAQGPHDGHGSSGQMSASGGSAALHKQMMKAAGEMRAMSMTGDVDHDFVAGMKKHHQHGIEMAQIALRSGKDAKARSIAQKIIDEQRKDIEELDSWLAAHKPSPTK
jgi:uncharacterized protein (DUF305 family)